MQNKFEETPKQEKVFLNNFFLYLPGGSRRSITYEKASKKRRIMDAIDKLLQEEFPDINPQEIFSNISKSNELIARAYDPDNNTPEEEQEQLAQEAKILSESADNKLRPLFNRLIEMGFEKGLLTQ